MNRIGVHISVKSCALAFMALLFLAPVYLKAQTVTGRILGNILDSSGGAVPNAEIIITNQDTGVSRASVSNNDGVYVVPALLPGKYSVEAKSQGFNTATVKDVVVAVGSEARVDLQLQIGSSTQAVTVTESIPTVEATSSEVSQVMDEAAIESIPLNARDVQQLAVIQPGVQSMTTSYAGRAMTVLGDRPSNNRFLQEGMDVVLAAYRTSPVSLATGVMLGAEAVKEFKVLTTDFTAEYGERSGGTVNILFRSGTNRLHGSAYEYYRNSVFDARNFFDQGGTPPFHRNQFGASLGGPIRRDKTFFFLNYEGFRSALSLSAVANVPNAAARGTGGGSPGQLPCQITTTGCGSNPTGALTNVPVSAAVYNLFFAGANPLYPACNGPSVGGGLCRYFSSPVQNILENYGLVKIDHSFGAKNTLSSTYNIDRGWQFTPSQIGATADDRVHNRQTFSVQDTYIISASLVNTIRFGITRSWYNDARDMLSANNVPGTDRFGASLLPVQQLGLLAAVVPCASVCTPGTAQFPSGVSTPVPVITISGGMTQFAGSATAFNFAPRWIGDTTNLLSDDVNLLRGKHALQFGIEAKRWYDNLAQYRGNPVGTYAFQNLPQFLAGGPAQTFGLDKLTTTSSYGRSWSLNLLGIYGQDTYKLGSNLTLSYGLRWEYVSAPNERYGRLASSYNPTPLTATAPAVGSYFDPPKHNFAPRLGFNWDPFKKGTTSVRGGIGIFYNEIEDNSWFTLSTAQPPFVSPLTLNNSMTLPFQQSIFNAAGASGVKPNISSIERHPHTPIKTGYNLTLQQAVGNWTVMVAYVGAQQRHQGRSVQFQEYNATTVEQPGQLPMVNGVPIPGSVVNPSCTSAGQLTCLYWAGVGATNANILGNVVGSNGATAASVPYATLCTATIHTNCFNNNNFGNSVASIIFDANSRYDAFQTALQRRLSAGLFLRFNYTFSKCLADAVDDFPGSEANASSGNSANWSPTLNHSAGRGRCAYGGTNAVNFSFSYDLPFGKAMTSRFARGVVAGWQISSLTAIQSGIPIDVRLGANTARAVTTGNGASYPDWAVGCDAHSAINKGNPANYINASCFTAPPLGYLGNVGPYVLTAPATVNTDLSLKKSFVMSESKVFQLSADMFNVFNHTNFAVPNSSAVFVNAGTTTNPNLVPNSTLGQILQTIGTSRQFQIGARFEF